MTRTVDVVLPKAFLVNYPELVIVSVALYCMFSNFWQRDALKRWS